eukprot:m51a1_g3254 putative serine threonine-protein kinase endoribonuclease ire1 (961) ;mRNA; f:169210-172437
MRRTSAALLASLAIACAANPQPMPVSVLPALQARAVQLVACTLDGRVYSVDPKTGALRWATELPASDSLVSSSVSPAALPAPPAIERAPDSSDDECAKDEEPGAGAEGLAEVRLLPTIDGTGGLFVLSTDGQNPSLHRLKVSVPEIVKRAPFTGSDGLLYLGSLQNTIYAIEASTGIVKRVYSQGTERMYPFKASPNEFLLGRADYVVHAVDAQSSTEIWNVTLGEYKDMLESSFAGAKFPIASRASDNTLALPGKWRVTLSSPTVAVYVLSSDMRMHKLKLSFEAPPPEETGDSTALVDPAASASGVLVLADQQQGGGVWIGKHKDGMYAVTPRLEKTSSKLRPLFEPEVDEGEDEEVVVQPSQPRWWSSMLVGAAGVAQTAIGVVVGIAIASLGWFSRRRSYPPTPQVRTIASTQQQSALPPLNAVTPPPQEQQQTQSEQPPAQQDPPKAEQPQQSAPHSPADSAAAQEAVKESNEPQEEQPAKAPEDKSPITPEHDNTKAVGSPLADMEPADDWEQIDPDCAADLAMRHIEMKKQSERAKGFLCVKPQPLPALPALPLPPVASPPRKRMRVGRLELSGKVLGHGSAGTIVYEGLLDGRRVAVKRLLKEFYDVAKREVDLLIESDEHPNVVRYYAKEEDEDFVYIALSFCERPLNEYVEERPRGGVTDEVKLIMHDILSGISHIHALNIVHRDLKPQNILLDAKNRARISDMGLAKKFEGNHFSFSVQNAGSAGWMAPELLTPTDGPRTGMTRAVDVFAIGCIFYYIATKRHPYGERLERDANIATGKRDLSGVADYEELHHLIYSMTMHNPSQRISAADALKHPFFWPTQMKLQFLLASSDRLEVEKPTVPIVTQFESQCGSGVRRWERRLDPALLGDLTHHRKYNFDSARDLLRVMRNKANHYYDLPENVRRSLGSLPDGFLSYFMVRYPHLLMNTYSFMKQWCSSEPMFSQFFNQ